MKRIKWKNLIALILLLISIGIVLHDTYYLTIYSSITGKLMNFTWFGAITFLMAFMIGGVCYIYLKEQ